MLQRPKRGETEDDILLQQREFLASRSQAAARQGTHYHAGEKLTLSGTREDTSCKSRDVVDLSSEALSVVVLLVKYKSCFCISFDAERRPTS